MKQASSKYANLSLVSTIVTATMTSIHHAYEIGIYAAILVVLFIVSPTLLMRWFRNTGNKGSLWAYGLLNTWLVVGLGLVDGLWNHIIKPIGFQFQAFMAFHGGGSKAVESAVAGNFIHEATGVLTFVASVFAAYYGYKFIRTSRQPESVGVQSSQ